MLRISRASLPRGISRCIDRHSARSHAALLLQPRFLSSEPSKTVVEPQSTTTTTSNDAFDIFKHSLNLPEAVRAKHSHPGKTVTLQGFLGKKRRVGSKLMFFMLEESRGKDAVQVISTWDEEGSPEHKAYLNLASIPSYSSVSISVHTEVAQKNDDGKKVVLNRGNKDYKLQSIQCLNAFPKNDIIVSQDAVWAPKHRHLQIRFDELLQERLKFRDSVVNLFDAELRSQSFLQIETPLLFKSTPEGAREYLVPTRKQGLAYALPQSPQQYKQILMAAGIQKYYQFAKCFRDEDHRADRQPEFTQLDLEMSFATGAVVMELVERLIRALMALMRKEYRLVNRDGVYQIKRALTTQFKKGPNVERYEELPKTVMRMTYDECMRKYGTDKPDLRIKPAHVSEIINANDWVSPSFKGMITNLEDPVVEACKFRFRDSPTNGATFIRKLFDKLPSTPYKLCSDSTPGVLVFDPNKPLSGLSSLGHEGAAKLLEYRGEGWTPAESGDVIILHARENQPHHGGSTELGRLRKFIYDSAVEEKLMRKDYTFKFLWVTEFPLFSPNDDATGGGEAGQGGSAGFRATHHPFTAPLTPEDFDLLRTDPLQAKADHYDLVLNGVEVGGGSRRIHVAEVQEYVMRDILQMTDKGVAQFAHLLDALRTGCPPHAGFAIGLDRLLAVICDVPTVRDVIAFPKNNKGEDQLVNCPSRITESQQKIYHLK